MDQNNMLVHAKEFLCSCASLYSTWPTTASRPK